MIVFDFATYRDVMKKYLEEKARVRGYKASLARAIGCQGSYVSQVLIGKVHLTPDQAVAMCEFWELDELETSYFLALVNFERASTDRLRKRISIELENLRKESISFATLVPSENARSFAISPEQANFYWSSWECSAILELLKFPEYRTVNAIAARLSLSSILVKKILDRLSEMNFAKSKAGEWHRVGAFEGGQRDEIHSQNFHRALRSRSNEQLKFPDKVPMTFSGLDTIAKDDIPLLVNVLRDVVKKQSRMSQDRNPEELVSLCIDFFIV